MRASPCGTSRIRFLTLDLCYPPVKQQTQLPPAWSELQIFHSAGQHESAATFSPLKRPQHPNALVYFSFSLSLEFTQAKPLPCPWKVLHLVPWQSCHQTEFRDPLRSDFPCQSVPCCLSLFKGDFLSSKLSNLKNNELNSPSLFRESTFPEQRERSFRNLASVG